MLDLNIIAWRARERQFYHTPYRTGNLARSVGDLASTQNEASYIMFDRNQVAPYGAVLNESKVITRAYVKQGQQYTKSYENQHFGWVDKFADAEADEIDLELGTVRG